MSKKRSKNNAWWFDKLILKILSPILWIFRNVKTKPAKKIKTSRIPYGSSEECYCGSKKKYKHCCKKVNKKEGKVAIKIIKVTKRGTKIKIKIVKPTSAYQPLFKNQVDSGIDPTQMV